RRQLGAVPQNPYTPTATATTGIFKNVKSSDKRLESWLAEVPTRLAVLMRDIQHVLRDLGHMPEVIISGDDEKRLAIVDRRDAQAYSRWRERHGDASTQSREPRPDWSIRDDPVQ